MQEWGKGYASAPDSVQHRALLCFSVNNIQLMEFYGTSMRWWGVQVAALEAADEADEVAARIGAANTLVRQPDGTLKVPPSPGIICSGPASSATHAAFGRAGCEL